MNVPSIYLNNILVSRSDKPHSVEGASPGRIRKSPEEGNTHISSPELEHFLDQVQETPEIRQDRVEQATQRLATGFYLTPEAADLTAQAIIDQD